MRTSGVVALFVAGAISGGYQSAEQTEIIEQTRSRWLASSEYTLAVAEQMPAEKYDFRATPEQMTFAQQLLHISEQNELIFREMLRLGRPERKPITHAKADVITRLKETSALGLKVLQERMSASTTNVADLLNGMTLALDHTTHHRGQAIVYLRLNGMTPPEYRR